MADKLDQFFDGDIEPAPICRNCNYYDGNGLLPNGEPREAAGGCRNKASPCALTTIDGSCTKFFPCGQRWPHADHD